VVAQQMRTQSATTTPTELRPEHADVARAAGPDHLTSPPRAPPVRLV